MASRGFSRVQALEKEIKKLHLRSTFTGTGVTAATGTLNLTTDIVLTALVADGAGKNTHTVTLQVLAAAANPTDTVLLATSGTAAATTITVTPNDGTNNSATPVDLTTAQLVEVINTGSATGVTVTVTDSGSLLDNFTATGGDATALADSGEGDGVAATFSGGVDTLAPSRKLGISSVQNTAVGIYRITLQDQYVALVNVSPILMHTSALGYNVELSAEDVDASSPYVELRITNASGAVVDPADAVVLFCEISLKNSTVGE